MLKENFRIFLQLLPLKAGVCSNKTYAKSEASSCNENHFKIHTLHIMHLTKFFLRRKESQHHVNKHLKFSVDFQFMWAMDFNNIFRWKLIDGSRNLNRKISRRCWNMRDSHIFILRMKWDVDCMNMHSNIYGCNDNRRYRDWNGKNAAQRWLFFGAVPTRKMANATHKRQQVYGCMQTDKITNRFNSSAPTINQQRCKYFVSNEIQMAKRHIHYAL